MLDQALFQNTNALLKDCRWEERYNAMTESYGTFNSDEHTAQFRFNMLKIDQVLSVYVVVRIIWSIKLIGLSTLYNDKK